MDSISTQAAVQTFNSLFAQLLENYTYHVESSLSRAHGLELVHGWVDSAGNDLRTYQDSGGHVLSSTDPAQANFLRIVVNGVPYFAPVQLPSPDPGGQPGVDLVAESAEVGSGAPASCALITDYGSLQSLAATDTNSLLLEHARTDAVSAHVALVALSIPLVSVDTHVLATHRLRLQYNGTLYDIPCSTRLGGPFQPLRNAALSCDRPSVRIGAGSPNSTDVNFTAQADGTKPFSYAYEWSITDTANTYVAFPYDGLGVMNDVSVAITNWSPGVTASADKTTPLLHFSFVRPGSDRTRSVYIRCKITQTDGTSAYTDSIKFTAQDVTGNWVVMETMRPLGGLTPSMSYSLYRLRLFALRHHREEAIFYLGEGGRELIERARTAGYDFDQLRQTVNYLASSAPYKERYARFLELVCALLAAYWPSCPHLLWSRHRRDAKQGDGDLLGAVGGNHHAKG